MLTLIILLPTFLVVGFIVGSRSFGSLVRVERLYLIASPVPLVLAFGFPAILVLLGMEIAARMWLQLFSEVGVWLSILLVWRNYIRYRILDWRLYAGVVFASIPALMLLVIDLLYLASHYLDKGSE